MMDDGTLCVVCTFFCGSGPFLCISVLLILCGTLLDPGDPGPLGPTTRSLLVSQYNNQVIFWNSTARAEFANKVYKVTRASNSTSSATLDITLNITTKVDPGWSNALSKLNSNQDLIPYTPLMYSVQIPQPLMATQMKLVDGQGNTSIVGTINITANGTGAMYWEYTTNISYMQSYCGLWGGPTLYLGTKMYPPVARRRSGRRSTTELETKDGHVIVTEETPAKSVGTRRAGFETVCPTNAYYTACCICPLFVTRIDWIADNFEGGSLTATGLPNSPNHTNPPIYLVGGSSIPIPTGSPIYWYDCVRQSVASDLFTTLNIRSSNDPYFAAYNLTKGTLDFGKDPSSTKRPSYLGMIISGSIIAGLSLCLALCFLWTCHRRLFLKCCYDNCCCYGSYMHLRASASACCGACYSITVLLYDFVASALAKSSEAAVLVEVIPPPPPFHDPPPPEAPPKGWKVTNDKEGNEYYYNETTKESSWDFPILENRV